MSDVRVVVWKPPRRKGQLYFRAQQVVDFMRKRGYTFDIVEDRGKRKSVVRKIVTLILYLADIPRVAGYDVIVFYPSVYAPVIAISGHLLGKKLVLDHFTMILSLKSHERLPGSVRSAAGVLDRLLYRITDVVMTHTATMKEDLVAYYGIEADKVKVVYPVLDTQLFSPQYDEETQAIKAALGLTGKKIVLYHGMHHPWHGLPYLLEAARILRPRGDIAFLIFPRGRYADEENIVFLSEMPYQELPAYIQAGDLWASGFDAHSSDSEAAIGSCLLQAMAMARPVITAPLGERRMFEDEKTVFFVEPENPTALADKIRYCLEHEALARQVGQQARELAIRLFDIEAMNRVLEQSLTLASPKS